MKKQIVIISSFTNNSFFLSTDHCQDHGLDDTYDPCTHYYPSTCAPRKRFPDGIINSIEDVIDLFYHDLDQIENPDESFKVIIKPSQL